MTTEVTNPTSAYRDAFQELIRAGEPSWLRDLRQDSFIQFERAGFPTVDQEDWKYTNVAPVAKTPFRPVIDAN